MALIKAKNAATVLNNAIALDLGDIQRQADALIARAQAEADRIVEAGRVEAQGLIDEAASVGHAKGLEAGTAQGIAEGQDRGRDDALQEWEERLEALVTQWSDAAAHWETQRTEMLLNLREDVLAFAMALGERIVHRVIEHDPQVAVRQIEEALMTLRRHTEARVHICPDDRAAIDAALPSLRARLEGNGDIELIDDQSIARGGCVVRTARGGSLDAQIQTQLDRITDVLLPPRPEDDIIELEPEANS